MVGGKDNKAKAPQGRIVVKKIRVAKRNRGALKNRTGVAKKTIKSLSVASGVIASTKDPPTKTKPSFGLPSFRIQATGLIPSKKNTNEESFYSQEEEDLPSDTLMAIHSLIQSDRGLHVPITNNGSVQVILESQVYSIFDENHASNINAELLKLIETNKVKRMCCHEMSTMAIMLTEDYVKAVWDAHYHNEWPSALEKRKAEGIVAWFLAQLHHWTKPSISESSITERWEGNEGDSEKGDEVLRYLLNAQFLLRDKQDDEYVLWLPYWGTVLKTWHEARKQLLTLLAQRKEMSKANVLQKNRHSRISTAFLIGELLSQEMIRVVERPFGSFLQLIRDS